MWYAVWPVTWTDFDGTVTAWTSLQKIGAIWWNADAESTEEICWNWYVEFIATASDGPTNNRVMIWLNSDPSSATTYTILDYAIYYYRVWTAATNKRIYIYEDWINRGQFWNRTEWDVFRVERVWTAIEYKKNWVTFYTAPVASSATLYVDTSLYETSSEVSNVIIEWPSCQLCWNWIIEGTEICDDSNANNNDWCSDVCEIESWYYCVWEPSVCSIQLCSSWNQVEHLSTEHWIWVAHVAVTSPDRALWTPNWLWAYMNAQDDQLDIEMTAMIPAWMSFDVYLAKQTTSFYYQWYAEVYVSSDWWSTYKYLRNIEPSTLYNTFTPHTVLSPYDVTHVRLVNKWYNVRRWWRMYVDAIVANTYSCCWDWTVESKFESCDDANISSWDWCSDVCEIEENYTCDLEPSSCELFCDASETYSEYAWYIYWTSETNIGVSSPNNALWDTNWNVATVDGRIWEEITIEMSDTITGGQEIVSYLRVYSPASWYYEQDIDIYFSSDWWSTFIYAANVIWTVTNTWYPLQVPFDVTHIKYVPTNIVTYWTILYLDAVVWNDFSCCWNSVVHPEEECDEGWETTACTDMCLLPVCWDSMINGGEECDDANTVSGDGCSATCKVEYCRDDAPLNDTSKNFVITDLTSWLIAGTSTQTNSEVAICFEDTSWTRDIFYITTDASGAFTYTPNLTPYATPWVNVGVMLHDENGLDIDHKALIINN